MKFAASGFAIAVLTLACGVGHAQSPFGPIPAPTIRDVDPGIDHGSSVDALPSQFHRQPVFYRTHEAPGTIIINTADRFLYLIQGNNRALRYGVGVGRRRFSMGRHAPHLAEGGVTPAVFSRLLKRWRAHEAETRQTRNTVGQLIR